jgi:hypothetical protein
MGRSDQGLKISPSKNETQFSGCQLPISHAPSRERTALTILLTAASDNTGVGAALTAEFGPGTVANRLNGTF